MGGKIACFFLVGFFIVTFLNDSEACLKCGLGLRSGLGFRCPIFWGGLAGLGRHPLRLLETLSQKLTQIQRLAPRPHNREFIQMDEPRRGQARSREYEYGNPQPMLVYVMPIVIPQYKYPSVKPRIEFQPRTLITPPRTFITQPRVSINRYRPESVVDNTLQLPWCTCLQCQARQARQARNIRAIRKRFRRYY